MRVEPQPLDPAAFALRCSASQGATTYLVYVAPPSDIPTLLAELQDELTGTAADAGPVETSSAAQLLEALAAKNGEATLVINASAYGADDWALLDRRRSSLQRSGVTVMLTTVESFDELMRNAPNLMSWLGGDVFAFRGSGLQAREHAKLREARLVALRQWSGWTDDEVLERARAGTLPRDPEYGEWLVLLGRGDLLDG